MFDSLPPPLFRKTITAATGCIAALIMLFLAAAYASAEAIQLISGKLIEGKIVLRNEELIKVDMGLGIPVTYYLDEIAAIDGEPLAPAEEDAGAAEAIEPVETGETPDDEKPTAEAAPGRDIAPAENQDLVEEPAPPPAVKPGLPASSGKDLATGKSTESYLMGKIMKEAGLSSPQPHLPKAGQADRKKEIKDAIIRKVNQYVKRQTQNFEESRIRFQQKLPLIREKLEQIPPKVRRDILILASSSIAVIYALVCFPFMKIAKRLNIRHAWIAWIPILQIFLFIRMANKSLWWVLLFFVPAVGLFVPIILWIDIAQLLQKPFWLGILMIVPGLNIFILWYLAVSRVK